MHGTARQSLVMPHLPESCVVQTAVETQPVAAAAAPKRGKLIAWPKNISAALQRVKKAISPAANADALRMFESGQQS